jgi:hypothetical protein
LVEKRARKRCDYCQAPQQVCGYRFPIEHIGPVAEGGSDAPSNRALGCASCNRAKSDKRTGVDPQTGKEVALFNPRRQVWQDHFRWADDRETLIGLTATGRATVATLDMNSELRKEACRLWFETGWLP